MPAWTHEEIYLRCMLLSPLTILTKVRRLLWVVCLCVAGMPSTAAEFTLPDTISITAGQRREIVLRGVIEAGGATKLRIRYTPGVVRIISARGTDRTSQYCQSIELRDSLVSGTEAYAILSCPFSRPAIGDTVCFLTVEGIAGPERYGQITVESVVAADSSYQISSSSGGIVDRTGGAFGGPRTDLAITGNYPNPFYERTRIVFRTPSAENVLLTLRTLQGRLIRSWTVDAVAGENSYELTLLPSDAATGMYILELRASSGTAYHSVRVKP